MATYVPILPPPQSVDSLDAWGGLDFLPWSLDSGVWLSAGVYGILAEESAQSADSLKKWVRVRTSDILQGVAAGGEAEGNIIRDLVISDSARMDGEQIGGVARAIPIAPIHCQSSEEIVPYRVRDGVERGAVASGNLFTVYRVRTDIPEEAARSSDMVILFRMLMLLSSGVAEARGSVSPEYKGWSWDGVAEPEHTAWNAMTIDKNDWEEIRSEESRWRGVVQWQ